MTMTMIQFNLTIPCKVTDDNISDLLVAAFEGGINYWCGKVETINIPTWCDNKVIYASDAFKYGAQLRLYDAEDPTEQWILTEEKLSKGIQEAMKEFSYGSIDELMDNHDADTADFIIQMALFNEMIYG
jgi:hypothetical protein